MRRGDGEQVILSCRLSKGWTARVAKTFTSAEFPGTAILWEERYFEVVIAEPLAQGGVRYVLEPWPEHHAMRVTDRYDADSEAQRIETHRQALLRDKQRKSANALGVFLGHLPAIVQEKLGRELGVLPARLTLVSIVGVYIVLAAIALVCVNRIMAQKPVPLLLLALPVMYLGLESAIRFHICWSQSRPMGSVLGFIGYSLYYAVTRRGPSPFAKEKGLAVPIIDPPAEAAARDAFVLREPFVTLLAPADQTRVAERFGYDYRRQSVAVAATILIVAVIGVASSFTRGALIALVIAAALGAEQVVRLFAFRRGPAGSVLRFVVRPFVRKLL